MHYPEDLLCHGWPEGAAQWLGSKAVFQFGLGNTQRDFHLPDLAFSFRTPSRYASVAPSVAPHSSTKGVTVLRKRSTPAHVSDRISPNRIPLWSAKSTVPVTQRTCL